MKLTMKHVSNRGFTMIEIIIALSLIGLFVSVPILAYGSYIKRSRDIKRKNDINQLSTALQQFKNSQGQYPASTNGAIAADLQTLVDRGYIPTIPKDPKDGNLPSCDPAVNFCYTYSASSDGNTYTLNARLEDGTGSSYFQSTPAGAAVITSTVTGGPLTSTPIPSNTPLPSYSPIPTSVPSSTRTPTPSRTLTPTPTSVPPSTWSRQFGGSQSDGIFSIRYTSDNGYLMGGYTYNNTAGSVDMALIKLNNNTTTVEWKTVIGGTGSDRAIMDNTADGGAILAGPSNSYGSDFLIVKVSSTGTVEWSRNVGGASSTETAWAVQQTSDNGYIVVGTTNGFSVPTSGIYAVKLTSTGDVSWTKVYSSAVEQGSTAVTETSDGGFAIGGYRGSSDQDLLVIKTDSSGNISWQRSVGITTSSENAYAILQTDDNNSIVAMGSSSAPSNDIFLTKFDMNGVISLRRTYNTGTTEFGYDFQQTSDGGYIIAGMAFLSGHNMGYLLKVDSTGGHQWSRAYNASSISTTVFRSVQQLSDGSYIAGGENLDSSGYSHFYAVKTSSTGTITGCSEVTTVTAPTPATVGLTAVPVPTTISTGSITGIPVPATNTFGNLTQRCN
jgi:prepilin-type N-terminal cleavage/methylation domain-containing protein